MNRVESVRMNTKFDVTCISHWHVDGSRCSSPNKCGRMIPFAHHLRRLEWREQGHNLVTTVGFNKLLDATFKTGLTTPAWYVGLVNNASFSAYAAGDTMSSHAGWLEGAPYSNATRPAFTPGSISGGSVDNSAAKAAFTINATLTIRGLFLVDNNTVSGTTGTLYGAGDISVARSVLSGDTLNAQITLTAS